MNYRGVFEAASMDYVDLQCLNYDAVVCCDDCVALGSGVKKLAVDGITIGFQGRKCHFSQPWNPLPDDPPKYGSTFHMRLLITNVKARKILLNFGEKGRQPGLDASDFDELTALLQTLPPSSSDLCLTQILTDSSLLRRDGPEDRYIVSTELGDLLFALGTTAPACQLMPPRDWDVLESISQGEVLHVQAIFGLCKFGPIVGRFLVNQWVYGTSFSMPIRTLVGNLVKVRKICTAVSLHLWLIV